MSAVHLASTLSLWPAYRYGIIVLSMTMLEMEGADLASKVLDQVNDIRDQVRPSVVPFRRSGEETYVTVNSNSLRSWRAMTLSSWQ